MKRGSTGQIAVDQNCKLEDLKLAEFQKANKVFDAKVFDILTPDKALASSHQGGTAPEQVKKACARIAIGSRKYSKLNYLKTLSLIVVGILLQYSWFKYFSGCRRSQ